MQQTDVFFKSSIGEMSTSLDELKIKVESEHCYMHDRNTSDMTPGKLSALIMYLRGMRIKLGDLEAGARGVTQDPPVEQGT